MMVQLTETFQKAIKALKKKYPHVKDDLSSFFNSKISRPLSGTTLMIARTRFLWERV